tara:strand:+ start:2822 stop:4195 length:1374 start_codon:yes stop_codon:yes gene_type:complete
MNGSLDKIKTDIAQATKDGHASSVIKIVKASYLGMDFTEFGKPDKIPAIIDRELGHLANKAVMAKARAPQTGVSKIVHGILIGAIGTTVSEIHGVIYSPSDKLIYSAPPDNIFLEESVTEGESFITIIEHLITLGYDIEASDIITSSITGRIECLLVPGSTTKYKIYINLLEIEHDTVPKKYFFLGTQIQSSSYTLDILSLLHKIGISTPKNTSWTNILQSLPAQIAITPLIRLEDFLQKFELTDIADCGKILKFYAYDMAINNFTGVAVNSITTASNLFTSVDELRQAYGHKKEKAEEILAKQEAERVNFEAYKTKFVSFLCNAGYTIVSARNGHFVFYDNPVYNTIIDSVLNPALHIKSTDKKRVSFYQHKIHLGYMALPPFFIDVDNMVLLPADSYTNYLNVSQGLGKMGSPESAVNIRGQNEWASFEGAIETIAQTKGLSPSDISLLLNLALK